MDRKRKQIAGNNSGGIADGDLKYLKSFYDHPCEDLAKELLGKTLVRTLDDGTRLAGIIVETEAYLGREDKASHSYGGKKTAKNEAMYMEPGTIYVYQLYGTHTCVNISAQGDGAAVLIRALDPTDGMDSMRQVRGAKRSDKGQGLKDAELGSGPSKLTQALRIDKAPFNKENMGTNSSLWLEKGIDVRKKDVITSSRIGIDQAEEWAKKPLRFYIRGNKSVSVRDKTAENVDGTDCSSQSTTQASDKPKSQSRCEKEKVTAESGPSSAKKVKLAEEKSNPKQQAKLSSQPSSTGSVKVSASNDSRYPQSFYDHPCQDLARKLLGKTLVRTLDDGTRLAGIIVETEAYLGREDKASHSYDGKKTARNEAMYMEPGTIYVYHIYGTHTCANISSQGDGAAVLIRALDPTDGMDSMRQVRGAKRSDMGQGLKDVELGSGPSKLTQALRIDKATFNKENMGTNSSLWLEKGIDVSKKDVITSSRIGIDQAEEWAKKPLRYYIRGNKSVSVRDKTAENVDGVDSQSTTQASDKPKSQSKCEKIQVTAESGPSSAKKVKLAEEKSNLKQQTKLSSQPSATGSVKISASNDSRYPQSFYDHPCEDLAKELLGKTLVRTLDDGTRLAGIVVETEAYLGREDKASHSYDGKKTAKNEAMYMEPATIYVYNIYGTHTCVNISAIGDGAAVLIRALDPTDGMDSMRHVRGAKRPDMGRGLKDAELGSGPSKLTQALRIDRATFNKENMGTNSSLWLEKGIDVSKKDVITSSRIGIDQAEEWAKKPLRYYIRGNKSVSVRDKTAENADGK